MIARLRRLIEWLNKPAFDISEPEDLKGSETWPRYRFQPKPTISAYELLLLQQAEYSGNMPEIGHVYLIEPGIEWDSDLWRHFEKVEEEA